MCTRAIQLRAYIDKWLADEANKRGGTSFSQVTAEGTDRADVDSRDLKRLCLSASEWHHLEVITNTLEKFKRATTEISLARTPHIQDIWNMYNALFDFLDEIEESWLGDDRTWPTVVREAVKKGREKLSKYYSQTDAKKGHLFNCAAVLDPTQKLTCYEVREVSVFSAATYHH